MSHICPSRAPLGQFPQEAVPVCLASPCYSGVFTLPYPSGGSLCDWVARGNPGPVLGDLLFCPIPPPFPPCSGGRQSKYAVNAFEVFDIETRSWTKFPSIPCKRAFSSFVTLDDRLYSLGGLRQGRLYRQPKFLRSMDVFDTEQGELGASRWLPTSPWLPISLGPIPPTLPSSHPSPSRVTEV